jgi:hypothetical protein
MNNKNNFKLSNVEYMSFVAENLPIDQIYTCLPLKVYWHNEDLDLLIGMKYAGCMESFVEKLSNAVAGNLYLHPSIKNNLGYLWNEEFQQKSGLFYIPTEDGTSSYWVGLNYFLWGTQGDANPYASTWLYNDEHGNIVLEVTEMYRWSMKEYDEKEGISFVSYEEFMKDYKPILTKIIPQKITQQWLKQAGELYQIFYDNEQKCRD